MRLVSKPQFDKTEIKLGRPVQLWYKMGLYPNQVKSQIGKFDAGDYGLIVGVNELTMVILLQDNKQVSIYVDDVANGNVTIYDMEVVKDGK